MFSAREVFSYHFPVSAVVAGALSYGFNSDPEYGTDRQAFAQRVGAAAAREASQDIFSDGILASILHENPRYFVMGPRHGVFRRIVYAADRVVLTRTDNGNQTVNISLLAGYGGSAALTQLYYPDRSRNTETILSTWGLSLGGEAIRNEIAEFVRFLVRGQPR